jgi:hypothetical protein
MRAMEKRAVMMKERKGKEEKRKKNFKDFCAKPNLQNMISEVYSRKE